MVSPPSLFDVEAHSSVVNEILQRLAPTGSFAAHKRAVTHSLSSERLPVTILVTGTTGTLGSAFLANLVDDISVAKIYAFNRPGRAGTSCVDRQKDGLVEAGFALTYAESPKVVFVEGDITKEGIEVKGEKGVFDEMRNSVTHIVHNAWPVNLAVKVTKFERMLGSLRTLIDFALAAARNPRFIFVSSVAALQNYPTEPIPERLLPIEAALGTGYGESKWIGEEMLRRAHAETGLEIVIARVAQLCGNRQTGVWRTNDSVPAVAQIALAVGVMPVIEGRCEWLPIDVGARCLRELVFHSDPPVVVHLVHPSPTIFQRIWVMLAKEVGIQKIEPLALWIKRIGSISTSESIPNSSMSASTSFLINLITSMWAGRDGPASYFTAVIECKLALEACPSLHYVPPLNERDVAKWVKYWKEAGILSEVSKAKL
ncbi:NAD(P)-binding protein [Cylindrobasidium torrendii FP15055 ss-10]|uniref:NAD(P)-binding protein n=1 Tax=Cylindrobasidium torrendii FP15055 ss-10 TaxID=1314674 RepID=A0A0D7BRL0_9AGAR|nr:NAD(P)-binding protein [Cylindrobasidium torrendii FP15055 ss-10]